MNLLQLTAEETNWARDAVVHERERLPEESEHYNPGAIDATLASAEAKLNDAIEDRPIDEGLVALLRRGCSPAEAIDYYAVEQRGLSQTDWADERGTSQQAISKNVAAARDELDA